MPRVPKWLILVIGVVLALVLAWTIYGSLTAKPKAEARLGKNQTEAATASGRDAVEAVGKQAAGEAAVDGVTKENERDIRSAKGADADVGGDVRDAGLRSLCRRASYRNHPRCVQHAPAE